MNVQKRGEVAAEKLSKVVCMIDLQSGDILKKLPSQHAAAKWLVESGKAKNLNFLFNLEFRSLHISG